MTLVPKNGYSYTGYTEPFVTTEAIGASTPLTKVAGYLNNDDTPVAIGVDGAVPIENTEFRNAGLFLRVITIVDGTHIETDDINFDAQARMQAGHGVFLIRDDTNAYQSVTDVVFSPATGIYTVTIASTANLTAYKSYKVAARVPDLGGASTALGQTFAVGDVVTVPYP